MSTFDRCLATVLVLTVFFFVLRETQVYAEAKAQRPDIVISVSGAVARPGVLRLPAEARTVHAIERCGGLTAQANRDRVELARPLQDGDHLVIPALSPTPAFTPEAKPEAPSPSEFAESFSEREPRSARRERKRPRQTRREAKEPLETSSLEPVDINRATVEDLDRLPGVGPVLAQRIVSARETAPGGTFSSLEELETIRGIKGKTLLRLRPHLKLEGP